MSKYFALYINISDHNSLLAISNDLWLIELFIGQRKLKEKNIKIEKKKLKDLPAFSDKNLTYYFGYAITEFEYSYIVNMGLEYDTEFDKVIFHLEDGLRIYQTYLNPKKIKKIKTSIQILKKKKKKLLTSKEFIKNMLENVLDRGGLVIDYMENMSRFIDCMEG